MYYNKVERFDGLYIRPENARLLSNDREGKLLKIRSLTKLQEVEKLSNLQVPKNTKFIGICKDCNDLGLVFLIDCTKLVLESTRKLFPFITEGDLKRVSAENFGQYVIANYRNSYYFYNSIPEMERNMYA